MGRVASVLLSCALLALAVWGSGAAPAAAAPKKPNSLSEIGKRLDALVKRIEALILEASKDPDEARVSEYEGYSNKRLKKTRGRVRAEDLVEIMVNPDKNFNLRERAMKVLLGTALRRYDPDLATDEKHGSRTKRAHFCKTEVLKHLRHDNRISRAMAFGLLRGLWPVAPAQHPVMMAYQVDLEATWKPAVREWDKFLKRH